MMAEGLFWTVEDKYDKGMAEQKTGRSLDLQGLNRGETPFQLRALEREKNFLLQKKRRKKRIFLWLKPSFLGSVLIIAKPTSDILTVKCYYED